MHLLQRPTRLLDEMLSLSRFAVMASGLFRSLRSAFQPPPAPHITHSATVDRDSPPSAIEADSFLPLLALFRPSDVADVLILAAHYARIQRWDSVETTYRQLECALKLRQSHHTAVSASDSVSSLSMYAPLVALLSDDECVRWLIAVQQCQRDASMLQARQPSSHDLDDGHSSHDNVEQSDSQHECRPSEETVCQQQSEPPHEHKQHEQRQQQCTDGKYGDDDKQRSSNVDESELRETAEETADGAAEAVAAPRKRKRARRKRVKGEWGEIVVPARKRSKRHVRRSSKATDEQLTAAATEEDSTEIHARRVHADDMAVERELIDMQQRDTVVAEDTVADEQMEAATVQGQLLDHGSSTAAAVTLHSRWKRPCKRLVRFRVVAGEEEQRQIEALQEEYIRTSGDKPPAPSSLPTVEEQQPTSLAADSPSNEPATPSTALPAAEQPVAVQSTLHSDAVQTAVSDDKTVNQPNCPPSSSVNATVGSLSSSPQPPPSASTDQAALASTSNFASPGVLHGTSILDETANSVLCTNSRSLSQPMDELSI